MKSYKIIIAGMAALILAGCGQKGYVHLTGYAQGGTWSVKYNTEGVKARPAEVQRGIEAILQDIDTTLSGYNLRSQLSRLNAGDTIYPSGMLMRMYARSYDFWQETEGALDVAAGPIFDIWGFGFRNDSLPSDEKILETLSVSGMGRLVPTMEEALLPDGRICAARLLIDCPERAAQQGAKANLPERSTQQGARVDLPERSAQQGARADFPERAAQKSASERTARHYGVPNDAENGEGPHNNQPRKGVNAGSACEAFGTLPRLNFNAIAQGYSCDTVASYLNSLGVKDMLVDIGEILCRGVNPSGKPWKVGVDRPTDGNDTPGADLDGVWQSNGIPVTDRELQVSTRGAEWTGDGGSCQLGTAQGIVTSGNYRKFYRRDGHKYAHTIDPRSGYPAENELLSATIVAPSAEMADAYATFCMVIGLEAAKQFILGRPEIEGYLIYTVSDEMQSVEANSTGGDSSNYVDSPMAEWSSPGFKLIK